MTIVKKGAREGEYDNYEYTARGNPVKVRAPVEPGEYELRYSTGQAYATLARAPITITPAKEEPGLVEVTAASALPAGSAVEIILDASGSMLQKIGKDRRIDIARQTLTKLVTTTIPAGTPFAFRVFGRMEDSCQSDLDVPLGPLNVQAVSAKIAALEAKNNAKTAIGASLEQVASDLRTVQGERLVILLTDGEETCGGDPAAAIEKLKKSGTTVRVNIVGFAIDDAKLAATFRHWADAGSGQYFDAQGAAALNEAMAQAMRPGFEVVDAQGAIVGEGLAGGEPVRVLPGNYTVRLAGRKTGQSVTVRAKEKTAVKFYDEARSRRSPCRAAGRLRSRGSAGPRRHCVFRRRRAAIQSDRRCEGRNIHSRRARQRWTLASPGGFDGHDLFLIPGLWDMHVHMRLADDEAADIDVAQFPATA